MCRRAVDVLASAVGLLVLSPVFLALGVAVWAQDGGSVLHRAVRVGCQGRQFRLMKFRTMVMGAEKLGAAVTGHQDPRVTRVGRFLRRTKLDELPQLWNVLRGDMSLVGPRPEAPGYVARYTVAQRAVLSVRPGITGPATLAYRHEERLLAGDDPEREYLKRIMPAKLAIDLDYLPTRSCWSDFRILLRTAGAVFFPDRMTKQQ
jgi:lipopolysaccharide/colanic/teichoic acid biosynthesis glycosyltransferase